MKRIRVLQISNQLGLGGTDKTLQILAAHLNPRYFEVQAVGLQSGGPRVQTLRSVGIPTFVVHGNLEEVGQIVRDFEPDIVNLHHVHMPLRYLTGTKIVLTHQFSKTLYPLRDELEFGRLLFNSTRTLQKYIATYGIRTIPENAEIIYNPIDVREIEEAQRQLSPVEVRQYRHQLGIEDSDFVVGRLGRPDVVKWSDFLIEAVHEMIRTDRTIKVVIQSAPQSRIAPLRRDFGGRVIVLPQTSSSRDIALFFSVIDVYAHASKIGESFGVSIAEAMAFKRPVVVNSTPHADNAQVELVDNNITGFVVDYPKGFAQAVLTLKDDPRLRRAMGEAGYHNVRRKYAVDVVGSQYERILLTMMNAEQDPTWKSYTDTLVPPITRAEMERGFAEYARRVKQTYGLMSLGDLIRYRVREPRRLLKRVSDYLEYRRHATPADKLAK